MNDKVFKMNLSPENIKYFVYKEKKYPFDYYLLKRTSLYISKNDQKFRTQTNIDLIDNHKFELSPDSITNFIQCCEGQDFHVNESNVFYLHFLSVQYEVINLQNIIKQYIIDCKDHFAFEILLEYQSLGIIDTTYVEDIISENFLFYINTKDLTLLPIQVLHRLIERYVNHPNQIDENLVNFLFKCLDKYGREASVLFSLIHVEDQQIDVIHRLLSEPYYDIFDFTFINSTLLKTTNDLSSKLNRFEIKYSEELSAMKQSLSEFEKMKESFETRFIPRTTSISFRQKVKSIKVDEEVTLTAVVEPENAIKIIKWSVSDNRMQIKNEKGTPVEEYSSSQIVLRGIHAGESTLTAMTVDGSNIQASITISVFQPVRSITIEPKVINIKPNEEMKITAKVKPKDASNKNVIWKITGNEIQMKDLSGEVKNEITGSEIILRGIDEGVSTLTLTSEDGSNIQCQTSVTVYICNSSSICKNKLNYAYGARVTYVSAAPYNTNSSFYVSKNGGYTGKNDPVNSSLIHSQDNFWGALNSYNTQGALENDDNNNNINMLHNGKLKNSYSSTTVRVSGKSTTITIIINPRAYYGDISNYTFKMSECYLASSNSDGDVGKYKIYVSTSNDESAATNPNDSSWTEVTDGSLETDATLTKVYSGGVNFKYIKLDLNSRGKSYIELSAIKVF